MMMMILGTSSTQDESKSKHITGHGSELFKAKEK
jgi:hypothetical protein